MTEQTPTTQPRPTPLGDHADARMVSADTDESAAVDRGALVRLDPDHPGFRDAEYRARRNRIAQLALDHKPGESIPDAPYTAEEHTLWRTVRAALEPAHERHACAEYLEAVRRLALPQERIPQLAEVSARVREISGFRLEPVAGLVEARVFLASLARGVFLCTQYIRHHSTPLYTPEPDVVHELLGHAATLASPRLAALNRLFGEAVRRTASEAEFARLARVYWYTVEFGVLREGGEVKAYGTGLLSSAGELEAMSRAELRPLDLEAASRLEYDPTRFQPVLFCADSFDAMCEGIGDFLAGWK
ncbi:MAG: phenylalanine 4-monooxygenase [Pyrinomonadaceae bacterium]